MKYPKHFSPLAVIVAGTLTLGMVFTAGAQEETQECIAVARRAVTQARALC